MRLQSNNIVEQSVVKVDWKTQWDEIVKMRHDLPAPIDSMGAEALAERNRPDDKTFRFQTLIGTMLSPQTKDAQTSQAFDNLVALVAPEPLTPSSLSKYSVTDIEKCINMVSFYTRKAECIAEAAIKCKEKFNDDIPKDFDTLLSFRGVGPKVGYLTFTIAWGETLGICVDTHVHRISNRLDWVSTWNSKSNGPEKTRKALEKVLPRDKWEDVNFLLVGFGQSICSAVKPKCEQCRLQSHCKYYLDPTHMR
jgi:endonuclease-3